MNSVQRKLYASLKRSVKKERSNFNRLWKINLNPEYQFEWDAMKASEGRLSGLEQGLIILQHFAINATPPRRNKKSPPRR